MSVVPVRSTSSMAGVDELPGKATIGNDPSKWRTNLPTYAKVGVAGVYPGIDLVYCGQQGQLEFDFVVAPGVDPGHTRFSRHTAVTREMDSL